MGYTQVKVLASGIGGWASAGYPVEGIAPTHLAASDPFDLETRGFVDSSDGKLRIAGRSRLVLSLRQLSAPPTAPRGWKFVAPVFDVTAEDRQRRAVTEIREGLQLRFDVGRERRSTVLVHDGKQWQVVPSEVDADGRLAATVDHLTPYTAGTPARSGAGTSAATPQVGRPGAAPTTAPSAVPPKPGITPGANATVAVATVPPATSETALADAARGLKGKSVRITSAAGYSGSIHVAVPSALQDSLGSALGAGGAGYYGLYNAVNEAVTVQAGGASAAGALTLLVEPKTTMPSTAQEARSQLATLFPGVPTSLTQMEAISDSYVFYAASGGSAYSVGYLSYEGVPLAYAMAGSGSYQQLVPKG